MRNEGTKVNFSGNIQRSWHNSIITDTELNKSTEILQKKFMGSAYLAGILRTTQAHKVLRILKKNKTSKKLDTNHMEVYDD